MITGKALTPFWITFPKNQSDGFPLGFGVTAWSEEDAWRILDERGYDQHRRAATVHVRPIEKVDEIHSTIRQAMGPIVVRGIWYPFTQVGTRAVEYSVGIPFEVEYAFEARGKAYVVARLDRAADFSLTEHAALDGRPIEQWVDQPRAVDAHDSQRGDLFAFCLRDRSDLSYFKPRRRIMLSA